PPAQALETVDLAVVHERPAAADEGVAVVAAGGAAGGGPDMGEEEAGANLPAQALQVAVRPGRQHVAIEAGLRPPAIPGDAEAVAIGGGPAFQRVVALGDQRMARRRHDVLEKDRLA